MGARISPEEARKALHDLPGWEVQGEAIVRTVRTRNWRDTLFVVNGIAALAEAQNHHPDLEVSYRRLRIRLTTHEVGGLTQRDLQLARAIQDWLNRIPGFEPQEV